MSEPPRASAAFFKGHGLGNDYLVFFPGDDWPVTPEAVRAVCDPHRGVGADGIVVVAASSEADPASPGSGPVVELRMFNPDGGEFERSGNGLRVAAAALRYRSLVSGDAFVALTKGGEAVLRIHGSPRPGVLDTSAELGTAHVGPRAVGLDPEALPDGLLDHRGRGPLPVVPVSVGNPHLVVFTDDLSDAALEDVGPVFAAHPSLESGANVQLARVDSDGLRIRIWERGVGRTSASGTSASAVVVAAVATGRLPAGQHDVGMDGGVFRVDVDEGLRVILRGPVEEVFVGELSDGFVATLASLSPSGGGA